MRARRHRGGHGRHERHEQGIALVEFAMVAPLLILLFFGILEFGMLFKTKLLVSNAVQVAARTGATLGGADDVDLQVLQALEQGFAGLPSGGDGLVLQAQVYQADSAGNPTGELNTYLYLPSSGCHWNPCPSTPAGHPTWTPDERDTSLAGGLDSIGVKIFYGHEWILGAKDFLPETACDAPENCMTETAVLRLEPTE